MINRHRDCITLTRWLNRLDKPQRTPRLASSTPPTRCLCGAASTVRRMQDIADHAGVNKALLHYHFRSKADLARGVWLRIASSFVPGIFEMMASDISLDEKIDRFVDAYHTRLAKHPYLLAYVISEAARHPDFVDDFYSAERRKAARRAVERVREQINERAKRKKSRLSRRISS